MNPSGSSIVTCPTCGVIWELEPQELSPEKFECAECGTTFKTTGNEGENRVESSSEKPKTIPLIQHSIGFVVVFSLYYTSPESLVRPLSLGRERHRTTPVLFTSAFSIMRS